MADVVKALKWKLDLLKRKLQNTESSTTTTITSEEDQQEEELARFETKHMLAQWNLEDFITEELYPNIAPHLFLSHGTLHTLSWLLSDTLDSRISKLATTISNSNKQGTSSGSTNIPTGFFEFEAVEDSEVKKRVLEKTVITAEALVKEIKHDLQDEDEDVEKRIERRTVPFWLNEHEGVSFLSNEWRKINELRLKLIQTGVELSCVLARFVLSLGGTNDSRVRRLHARIKRLSVGQRRDAGHGGVVIAGKFLSVMSYAGEGVRNKKMKGKVGEGGGVFDEEVVVEEFYECVVLLDAMMSTLCVPVRRNLVAGAIVRLEDMLGQVLCAMQGLKLRVGKKKSESWKELKVKIGELWAKVACIILEEDEVADMDED